LALAIATFLKKRWVNEKRFSNHFCLAAPFFLLAVSVLILLSLAVVAAIAGAQLAAFIPIAFLTFSGVSFVAACLFLLVYNALNFKSPKNRRLRYISITIYGLKIIGLAFHAIIAILNLTGSYSAILASQSGIISTVSSLLYSGHIIPLFGTTASVGSVTFPILMLVGILLAMCLITVNVIAFVNERRFKQAQACEESDNKIDRATVKHPLKTKEINTTTKEAMPLKNANNSLQEDLNKEQDCDDNQPPLRAMESRRRR